MDGTEVKRRKRTHNRTPEEVEIGILETRQWLKDESPLGEFGAVTIHRQMEEWGCSCLPSIRTIGNIIGRCGKVSRNVRKRKKAPATGWYLPEVVEGIEDVDCVDFIEKLHLEGRGRWVHVLNIILAHGRLAASFPMTKMSATQVVHCLLEHWRQHGFPRYVQFDNGQVFAGFPKPDCVGQVVKLCLQVGIIPVFAPPRETGPQNVVEGYNAQWQRGVWHRFHFESCVEVTLQSNRYVAAHNHKNAAKAASAPRRTALPSIHSVDLDSPLRTGRVIFLRRVDEGGGVEVLRRTFQVPENQALQHIRCELNIAFDQIKFYTLSRSRPAEMHCFSEQEYHLPFRPSKRSKSKRVT